jgi:hypothetical protein
MTMTSFLTKDPGHCLACRDWQGLYSRKDEGQWGFTTEQPGLNGINPL